MNNILPHVVMWSNMLMLQRLHCVWCVCVLKRKVVSNKMCTFCYHQRSTLEPSRCKGKGGDVCVCVYAWKMGTCGPSCLAFRSCEAYPCPVCVLLYGFSYLCFPGILPIATNRTQPCICTMCMQLQCTGVPADWLHGDG